MAELLSTELKQDLEYIYKVTGDIINSLEMRNSQNDSAEIKQLTDLIKFKLKDVGGMIQKDIYNCDYLITKIKTTI